MTNELLVVGVIVTYNGSSYIDNCLAALMQNIDRSAIIIIDNCSNDGTVKLIEEKYEGVTLVKLDRNYGFGAANNIGLRIALDRNADYVFLLNQDTYVGDNTVNGLVKIAQCHSGYGIFGPVQINGKGSALDSHFAGYVAATLISDLYMGKVKEIYPCRFINAAAWMVSRKCIECVGGFDPLFFHYGEDDDYINRVRYNKMEIGICPGIRVNHDRGEKHALAAYPESRKLYLEALKSIKNINIPFGRIVMDVFFKCSSGIMASIVFFQFRKTRILLSVFCRVLFQLRHIHTAREKSKRRGAFMIIDPKYRRVRKTITSIDIF